MSSKEVFNNIRLKNLKRAKLRQLECQLELQNKNNVSQKEIHQTMKDINRVQNELKSL